MSEVAPPRAAYVHVPFCRHRCGYCNFTLVADRLDLVDSFLQAIANEIASTQSVYPVDTLYFGGGTPSQLSADALERLTKITLEAHPLNPNYEWTLEANPGDVDEAIFDHWHLLGVNRVSLGGQSFRKEKLRSLERDHTAEDIARAVGWAQERNISVALDLIFATPGESLAQWKDDLEHAISLDCDHISTYGLTFEKGTPFWNRRERGELTQLDESLEAEMYEAAIQRLGAAGFEHYEISNFARHGNRSRHNQTYWSGLGYFAYGPGASRFLPPVRETNHRSTTTWIKSLLSGKPAVEFRETLADELLARERLVFGLRQLEGVDLEEFAIATGYSVGDLGGGQLDRLLQQNLLEHSDGHLRLTRTGLLVSDAIWPDLL